MAENVHRKGSSVVSYIALIIGLIGIGMGTVSFIRPTSPTQEDSIITGIWSSYGQENLLVQQNFLTYIPNLLIDFDTRDGENAYFVFNGIIEIVTPGLIQFVFWIDAQNYPQGFTSIDIPNIGGANTTTQVSFFYTLYSFPAGSHNVTVSVYSDSTDTTLYFSKLLVQTFND